MKNVISRIARIITTLFFMGYFPIAPGTFTSVIFSFVWFFLKFSISYWIITFITLTLGFALTGYSEKNFFRKRDPGEIVIDEASGMLIAFLGISTKRPILILLCGLVVFRMLDILKPFPVKLIEKLGGSAGIMLDDIFSGLVTNAILHILIIVINY